MIYIAIILLAIATVIAVVAVAVLIDEPSRPEDFTGGF